MTGRRRIATLAPAVALGVLVLAACGLEDDTAPRNITENDRDFDLEVDASSTVVPVGSQLQVYFLAPPIAGQSDRLRTVTRVVQPEPAALFTALVAGPRPGDPADIDSAVPSDLVLLGPPIVRAGVITLDVTSEIFDSTGTDLVEAMAQIVFTMTELQGIEAVLLRVDGETRDWPRGDGSLTREPLTTFDYPELNPTSQPDFPAPPAPNPPTSTS